MSITCTGCGEMICKPETVWYVCTKYSMTMNYLCGTCASCVPTDKKSFEIATRPYDITFGYLIAQTGSFNKYQWTGSHKGPAVFSTKASVVPDCIPYGDTIIEDLYPYYCPQEFMETFRSEISALQPEARPAFVREKLNVYGRFIGACLGLDVKDFSKIETIEEGKTTHIRTITWITNVDAKKIRTLLYERYGV